MWNAEGESLSHFTSAFEIPRSPLAPPKAGKPCSTFDIRLDEK
jgi:hypothetical protein